MVEPTPLTAAERDRMRSERGAWFLPCRERDMLDRLLAERDALAAHLAEARGIAWRLANGCRAVLRDAYFYDWPEVAAPIAAFDALHWPDPAPPAPER